MGVCWEGGRGREKGNHLLFQFSLRLLNLPRSEVTHRTPRSIIVISVVTLISGSLVLGRGCRDRGYRSGVRAAIAGIPIIVYGLCRSVAVRIAAVIFSI